MPLGFLARAPGRKMLHELAEKGAQLGEGIQELSFGPLRLSC